MPTPELNGRAEFREMERERHVSRLVYLQGPYGSGKTYLARQFAEAWVDKTDEKTKVSVIYVAVRISISDECERSVNGLEAGELLGGVSSLAKWTSAKDLKTEQFYEGSMRLSELNKPNEWMTYFNNLPSDGRMLICIDDYTWWRSLLREKNQLRGEDFSTMRELWLTGRVMYVLADEKNPLTPSDNYVLAEDEIKFIVPRQVVFTKLPTPEITKHMAVEKLQTDSITDRNLISALARRVCEEAGHYPLLISTMMHAILSDRNWGDLQKEELTEEQRMQLIDRIVKVALTNESFRRVVRCRWRNLGQHELEVLGLLAIAQAKRKPWSPREIFDQFRRRYGSDRLTDEQFGDALCTLRDGHLLLAQDNSIVSKVVFLDVLQDEWTKELAKEIGIGSLEKTEYNFNGFLWLWLLGFVFYLGLLLIIKPSLEANIGKIIPSWILLVAWVPAGCHLLRYLLKTK